jgi:hypothetical protein
MFDGDYDGTGFVGGPMRPKDFWLLALPAALFVVILLLLGYR